MAKDKAAKPEPAYEKMQFLQMYEGAKRDVLSVLLDDGKLYTKQDVETLLTEALQREVK